MGASLLALAKSIYYKVRQYRGLQQILGDDLLGFHCEEAGG